MIYGQWNLCELCEMSQKVATGEWLASAAGRRQGSKEIQTCRGSECERLKVEGSGVYPWWWSVVGKEGRLGQRGGHAGGQGRSAEGGGWT